MPQIQNLGNITYAPAMSNSRGGVGGVIADVSALNKEAESKQADRVFNQKLALTNADLQQQQIAAQVSKLDYDTKLDHYKTALEYAKLLPEASQLDYLNTPEIRAYEESLGLPHAAFAMPAPDKIPFEWKAKVQMVNDAIQNRGTTVQTKDAMGNIVEQPVPLNTKEQATNFITNNVPMSMVDQSVMQRFTPGISNITPGSITMAPNEMERRGFKVIATKPNGTGGVYLQYNNGAIVDAATGAVVKK